MVLFHFFLAIFLKSMHQKLPFALNHEPYLWQSHQNIAYTIRPTMLSLWNVCIVASRGLGQRSRELTDLQRRARTRAGSAFYITEDPFAYGGRPNNN